MASNHPQPDNGQVRYITYNITNNFYGNNYGNIANSENVRFQDTQENQRPEVANPRESNDTSYSNDHSNNYGNIANSENVRFQDTQENQRPEVANPCESNDTSYSNDRMNLRSSNHISSQFVRVNSNASNGPSINRLDFLPEFLEIANMGYHLFRGEQHIRDSEIVTDLDHININEPPQNDACADPMKKSTDKNVNPTPSKDQSESFLKDDMGKTIEIEEIANRGNDPNDHSGETIQEGDTLEADVYMTLPIHIYISAFARIKTANQGDVDVIINHNNATDNKAITKNKKQHTTIECNHTDTWSIFEFLVFLVCLFVGVWYSIEALNISIKAEYLLERRVNLMSDSKTAYEKPMKNVELKDIVTPDMTDFQTEKLCRLFGATCEPLHGKNTGSSCLIYPGSVGCDRGIDGGHPTKIIAPSAYISGPILDSTNPVSPQFGIWQVLSAILSYKF